MKRFSPPSFRWTLAALTLVLMLALPWAAMAAVWTDEQDYTPGSVVAIYGDNSDGAGYLAGETINVSVVGPNGYSASCDVIADENGAWSCQVTLPLDESAVGLYTYTAVGQTSGVSQSGTFTDSPKVGSVVVGSQVGTLTYGTAGSVTYTVTVYRGTAEAAFDANLCIKTALPTGASASFSVTPVSFALKEVSKTSTLTIGTSDSTPAGSTSFTVSAFVSGTCTSPADYATGDGTLTVTKATPVITWANPADIVYGTALSGTQLNATASVPGSFVYTPAAGAVLNAGAGQTLHVDFTPTDTANYNNASKDVTINVLQRPITLAVFLARTSAPTPSSRARWP